MQNWGKPVVLTNATVTTEIICRRDYPMSTSQPWLEPSKPPLSYNVIKFHDLPAGVATPPSSAATTMFFAFKINNVVFDLVARGEQETFCKSALLEVAEQIWEFNTKESPRCPACRRYCSGAKRA